MADLSKEAALRTLAATIAKLPEGDWKAADSEAIAARLLSWLRKDTKAVPQVAVKRSLADSVKLGFAPWLVWGALVLAVLLVTVYLQADHNLEFAPRGATTTQQ